MTTIEPPCPNCQNLVPERRTRNTGICPHCGVRWFNSYTCMVRFNLEWLITRSFWPLLILTILGFVYQQVWVVASFTLLVFVTVYTYDHKRWSQRPGPRGKQAEHK